MFNVKQVIPNPTGVSTFGSAVMRIAPDFATISCTISCVHDNPQDAFSEARERAKSVTLALKNLPVQEYGTSRISLLKKQNYVNGQSQFAGYLASLNVQVSIDDLEKIEEVICALVASGANEIDGVSFQTKKLKEIRAEARRMAVSAAREKALNYCNAAGVKLGEILHIEDVNPDNMDGRREGHVRPHNFSEVAEAEGAFDPSAIQVNAAVIVVYAFEKS